MSSSVELNASTLHRLIASSLPHNSKIKTPQEALSLVSHVCMLILGFRFIGHTENDILVPSRDEGSDGDLKPLPSSWNSAEGGSYGFRYSYPQESRQYAVKIKRLTDQTAITGIILNPPGGRNSQEDQEVRTSSIFINVNEFTCEKYFPYSFSVSEGTKESGSLDTEKELKALFVSEEKIIEFKNLFLRSVMGNLVPELVFTYLRNNPDDEGELRDGSYHKQGQQQQQQQQIPVPNEPLHVPRPYGITPVMPDQQPIGAPTGGEPIPGFDDEYDILRRYNPTLGPGSQNPLSIGDDDLNPPGLGGPFGRVGTGGMHPTPDHPMFGGRGGRVGGHPRAPPGARYDPVGPFDEPPMGGLRGPRGPGSPGSLGGRGGPNNPFSGFSQSDFM